MAAVLRSMSVVAWPMVAVVRSMPAVVYEGGGLIRVVSARTRTIAAHVAAVVVVQKVGERAIRLRDAEHLKPARRHSGLRHVHRWDCFTRGSRLLAQSLARARHAQQVGPGSIRTILRTSCSMGPYRKPIGGTLVEAGHPPIEPACASRKREMHVWRA